MKIVGSRPREGSLLFFLMGDIERNCLLCSSVYIPCIPVDDVEDGGNDEEGDDVGGVTDEEDDNDKDDGDSTWIEIILPRI